MSEIPRENLDTIFSYCDLPTRCKMRRVCGHWKHILSKPETNSVVIVNRRCLFVSKNQTGWFNVKTGRGCYRRSGLTGAHVTTLIYDGEENATTPWPSCDGWTTVRAIQTIGYHCPGVRHIVLWRVGLENDMYFTRFRKADFSPVFPSKLPLPHTLTLIKSEIAVCFIRHPTLSDLDDGSQSCLYVKAELASFDDVDQSIDTIYNQYLLPCTRKERQWLINCAPRLSEVYHKWAAEGITLCWYNHAFRYDTKVIHVNLKTEYYRKADWMSTSVQKVLLHLIRTSLPEMKLELLESDE